MSESTTNEHSQPPDLQDYVLCVVVKTEKRKYENFYLGVRGAENAEKMRNIVASKGFKTGGRRIFPDQIETLSLKVKDEQTDGQESQEHQEVDCGGQADSGGDREEVQGEPVDNQ